MINVGIIGAGANSYLHHIPKLAAIDGVTIGAVANRTRESGERAAADWSIPVVYDDWTHLVADDSIDAVVIGTWPNTHRPMTVAALEAGKHVLVEARMATDAEAARAMAEAAASRPDLVAQVVPSPLTLAVDEAVIRLVSSGRIGRLLSIDVTSHSTDFPNPTDTIHWRENRELSGNNIMALGIWYESVMRWIGTARSVFASGRVTVPHRRDVGGGDLIVEIPDYLDVVAEMGDDVALRMQFSRFAVTPTQRAILTGTEGVLTTENGYLAIHRRDADGPETVSIDDSERGTWRVEESFVGAIRGTEEVRLTDFATGLRYMEFTDAVWEAMRNERAVPLP